jgi:hypothetical protein
LHTCSHALVLSETHLHIHTHIHTHTYPGAWVASLPAIFHTSSVCVSVQTDIGEEQALTARLHKGLLWVGIHALTRISTQTPPHTHMRTCTQTHSYFLKTNTLLLSLFFPTTHMHKHFFSLTHTHTLTAHREARNSHLRAGHVIRENSCCSAVAHVCVCVCVCECVCVWGGMTMCSCIFVSVSTRVLMVRNNSLSLTHTQTNTHTHTHTNIHTHTHTTYTHTHLVGGTLFEGTCPRTAGTPLRTWVCRRCRRQPALSVCVCAYRCVDFLCRCVR